MQVKQIIKLLENAYEPDEELMIDWVDAEGAGCEHNSTAWSNAVGTMEGAYVGMIDMDYVRDTVADALAELEEDKQ